jgi:hypothetical protein
MRLLDPNDDFIPANPPAGWNRPYSPRYAERSMFAQSDDEHRYARHLKSQSGYDEESQTLVINYHANPVGSPTELKYALAEVRSQGRTVRRIRMYIHPSEYQDGNKYLELKMRGYERDESAERNTGQYAGQFCLSKTLKLPKSETAIEPKQESEKGTAA